MQEAAAIVIAYLIGSVSFGILVAASQGVDIRTVGSGNPGTSNILRILGKRLAVAVLVGDAVKGVASAALGSWWIGGDFGWVTLLVAVIGHSVPIWHRFRGGKSVATAIGGVLFLAPAVGLVLAAMWIVILVVWKTASIGSLVVMVALVPLVALVGRSTAAVGWASAIAAFVIFRHASNIRRLISADERKVTP